MNNGCFLDFGLVFNILVEHRFTKPDSLYEVFGNIAYFLVFMGIVQEKGINLVLLESI